MDWQIFYDFLKYIFFYFFVHMVILTFFRLKYSFHCISKCSKSISGIFGAKIQTWNLFWLKRWNQSNSATKIIYNEYTKKLQRLWCPIQAHKNPELRWEDLWKFCLVFLFMEYSLILSISSATDKKPITLLFSRNSLFLAQNIGQLETNFNWSGSYSFLRLLFVFSIKCVSIQHVFCQMDHYCQ